MKELKAVDGENCDLASKTKQATGMKYAEMCFSCYTPNGLLNSHQVKE